MENGIVNEAVLKFAQIDINCSNLNKTHTASPKKKRNRRRLRSQTHKANNEELPAFLGVITAILAKDSKCSFLRKRNTINKRISLNGYMENDKPYIWQGSNAQASQTLSYESKRNYKNERNKIEAKQVAPKCNEYEDYLSLEEVELGLADGTLVKGAIRINQKCTKEAYVSRGDSALPDFVVKSMEDRNRALEGDVVVLKIFDDILENDFQKAGKVVYILERMHSRTTVGNIRTSYVRNTRLRLCIPRDKRLPRIRIKEDKANYRESMLVLVEITDWKSLMYADGYVKQVYGNNGDLKAESAALLGENQIDKTPFEYVSEEDTQMKDENRLDLRSECIFTIDPSTAKDLDDAMSCKLLPNGNYQVGVHIADVSYRVKENTALDKSARDKATSTYLVDTVHHMLPQKLCMKCSLLPGRDNLAFSVLWEMTASGEIVSTQFTRSLINSCVQLSYEHAQKCIEDPLIDDANEFPRIENGYALKDIRRTICDLNTLAGRLREERVTNGSVRIDQMKYSFNLDENGVPISFYLQETKDSNRLIEEFMLLANIAVAKQIYKHFPGIAFLRKHAQPNVRMMADLQKTLEMVGIHVNVDSSKRLQESLAKYTPTDYIGQARFTALNHLLAKPMIRAAYFCTNMEDPATFRHYALSVPFYTHFTSPIRRYADVMVHRLLAASLGYESAPKWDPGMVSEIAERCNTQKFNAKRAGEASCELYMAVFVQRNGPVITSAVVVGVGEKSFDVLTIRTGIPLRIFVNTFDGSMVYNTEIYGETKRLYKINVVFRETKQRAGAVQVIEIFQIVKILIVRQQQTNKLDAFLLPPIDNPLPN